MFIEPLENRRLLSAIIFSTTSIDKQPIHDLDQYQGFSVDAYVDGATIANESDALLDNQYQWNFGDTTTGSAHNQLEGFNAAHVYDVANTYTITLSINGMIVDSKTIDILPYTPTYTIYVDNQSPDSSDTNNGLTQTADGNSTSIGLDGPVKTIYQAQYLLQHDYKDNTEILFRRGETFLEWKDLNADGIPTVDETGFNTGPFSNVLIGAYGDDQDPQPIIQYVQFYNSDGTPGGYANGNIEVDGINVTVQDLNFQTASGSAKSGDGVDLGQDSRNITVRDCSASGLGTFVNANNQAIDGVFIEDNKTSDNADYFLFNDASDVSVIGNSDDYELGGGDDGAIRFTTNDAEDPQGANPPQHALIVQKYVHAKHGDGDSHSSRAV